MIRREIGRDSHLTKKTDGEMGNWEVVTYEEIIREEGDVNETKTLSYEIHYKGHRTAVDAIDDLLEIHAATFMEIVDTQFDL